MKLGICSEIFKDWETERMFSFLKETGYEGLEIAPFTLAERVELIPEETVRHFKECSEKYGIRIIGTHWLLIKPEGLSVSGNDRALRDETAEYLRKLVDFTSETGGDIMVFGSPKQRNIAEGQTAEEVKANVREVLLKVLESCEKKGVFLCLEPLARTETNFINTAEEAVGVIEEINSPYLKLHLDVKAMSDEAKPIPDIIRDSRKHLKHFHVNDKNLSGPGFGEVDYKPVMDALKSIGYDGWLSVEVFDFSPGSEVIARKSIEYLKTFM